DDAAVKGTITSADFSAPLRVMPRQRRSSRDVTSLTLAGSTRVAVLIVVAAWIVTTTLGFVRAMQYHFPITGWWALMAPLRALVWTAATASTIWLTPIEIIG